MKRNLVGKILGKIKIFVQDFVPIRTALLTRSDNLNYLNLVISKESKRTESACCAISGKSFCKETALTASVHKNIYRQQ